MRRVTIVLKVLFPILSGAFFPIDNISACPPFELVITEILADPTPGFGLPEAEFIEIYNRSANSILLSDVKLNEGSSRDLPSIYIDAGEYVIICDDDDTSEFTGYGKVAWVSSMTLTNSGESIYLSCNSGTVIDSVYYSSSWYMDSYKEDGGWSLERIDTEFTCYNPSNWEPSSNTSGGTPGFVNSNAGVFNDVIPPVSLNSYQIDSTLIVIEFSEHIQLPVHLNQIHISRLGSPQSV